MSAITELRHTTMTAFVNNRKNPRSFLKNLLFGRSETLDTETIEIDVLEGDRDMAPFIKKNGEAMYVDGYTAKRYLVEAPNIRIKRGLDPSKLLDTRYPGSRIFETSGRLNSARRQHIADQLTRMNEMIDNTEEWMAAQVLTGTVSYSVDQEASFTITYPRPAGNNFTPTAWSGSTDIPGDFLTASEKMSEEVGLIPTDCILGANAAADFRTNSAVQSLLDIRRYEFGNISIGNFEESGALYLGRLHGIRVWSYPRSINVNGTPTALVGTEKAHFVNTTPAAENVTYYGAIPDMDAGPTGVFKGERFSKSEKKFDPSTWEALVHSRPLMVPRRPGAYVTATIGS